MKFKGLVVLYLLVLAVPPTFGQCGITGPDLTYDVPWECLPDYSSYTPRISEDFYNVEYGRQSSSGGDQCKIRYSISTACHCVAPVRANASCCGEMVPKPICSQDTTFIAGFRLNEDNEDFATYGYNQFSFVYSLPCNLTPEEVLERMRNAMAGEESLVRQASFLPHCARSCETEVARYLARDPGDDSDIMTGDPINFGGGVSQCTVKGSNDAIEPP
jgi:hypothetical protein